MADDKVAVTNKNGTLGYRPATDRGTSGTDETKINKAPAGGLGALAAANKAKKTEAAEPKTEEAAESAIDRELRLRREAKEKARPYPQSR